MTYYHSLIQINSWTLTETPCDDWLNGKLVRWLITTSNQITHGFIKPEKYTSLLHECKNYYSEQDTTLYLVSCVFWIKNPFQLRNTLAWRAFTNFCWKDQDNFCKNDIRSQCSNQFTNVNYNCKGIIRHNMYFAINCDQAWVISFVVTIVTYSCNFFTKFVTGQQGKSCFLHPTLPQTHQVPMS